MPGGHGANAAIWIHRIYLKTEIPEKCSRISCFLVEKNHASLCVESQLFSKVFESLLFGNAMFITVDQVVDIRFFRLLVIAADF